MLKEAKIDGDLMSSLGNSIKNFEGAAKAISPTVDFCLAALDNLNDFRYIVVTNPALI